MLFSALQEARLLRRYKRFLVDVALPGGQEVTVHCPNTGAMTGCATPGARVWLSSSDSKTRKYRYTWELVETAQGIACVHSARANKVVQEACSRALIPALQAYSDIQTEVKYAKGSRVDLLLRGALGQAFIEVKAVTLAAPDGVGLFPDAVSERARKHLSDLSQVCQAEHTRAILFYCVLHNGIKKVSVAGDIDPRYRHALIAAQAAGVEVLAWRAEVTTQGMQLAAPLPFSVDPV